MIAVTGSIDSIDSVHDSVRRMEEGAARLYDQLAAAAELMAAAEAATTLHSLAAAARRRARSYCGGTAKVEPLPPLTSSVPPSEKLDLTAWQVLEIALDMEYAMLTQLEMLAALAETDTVRDEAVKLAERKRLHLAELDLRQGRYPAPAGVVQD